MRLRESFGGTVAVFALLTVGWLVCLTLVWRAAMAGAYEEVPRVGALFIALGVLGLAISRPLVADMKRAIAAHERRRARDPAAEEEDEALLREVGGGRSLRGRLDGALLWLEVVTLLFGTLLDGYGDRLAAAIVGEA